MAIRTAIVSGGTYGIGRATTLALAGAGWRVVAFGLDAPQPGSAARDGIAGTRELLADAGLEATLLEADVSDEGECARVVDAALAAGGRIDAVVNNAAIHPRGTVLDTAPALWRHVLEVNLTGAYLLSRAALPHLVAAGGGAIVNIGSGAGWGKPGLAAYAASKGGLYALTMAMAHDHLHDHVRVNLVVPGGTETGMTEGEHRVPAFDRARLTASGRPLEPREVAAAVMYLLSDAARNVSGTTLHVGCFDHQGGPTPPPREADRR